MTQADAIRAELLRRFEAAREAGTPYVEVIARELHEALQQLSPTKGSRYPNVCGVMRQMQIPDQDLVISERASDGPKFAILYKLPRPR